MRKFILTFCALMVGLICLAQYNLQDVVYLNNGSIIRGFIIEQVPNKTIKIETLDGSIFVCNFDEIQKITKEPLKGKVTNSDLTGISEKGYQGVAEMGYAIKVGDYGGDFLRLHLSNGYRFNKYLYAGIGTGVHYYFDSDDAIIPLFADLKVYPLTNRVSPIIGFGVGYSFNASDGFSGLGLYLNPQLGVNYKLDNNLDLSFSIGFEMQRTDLIINYSEYDPYWNQYTNRSVEDSKIIKAISLNLGLTF